MEGRLIRRARRVCPEALAEMIEADAQGRSAGRAVRHQLGRSRALFDSHLLLYHGVTREQFHRWPEDVQESVTNGFAQCYALSCAYRDIDPRQVVQPDPLSPEYGPEYEARLENLLHDLAAQDVEEGSPIDRKLIAKVAVALVVLAASPWWVPALVDWLSRR